MRVSSYHWGIDFGGAQPAVRRLATAALVAVLAITLASLPADARRRAKHSSYSPPAAAMVIDAYTGKVLYAENENKPRFPASVTKVMTLYLLFEQLRKGDMQAWTPSSRSAPRRRRRRPPNSGSKRATRSA